LVATFDAAIARYPPAERRLMFGMPAAFLNGKMFAALHGERMVLRLPHAPREQLMAPDGAARRHRPHHVRYRKQSAWLTGGDGV
jgi:hypothetical protein